MRRRILLLVLALLSGIAVASQTTRTLATSAAPCGGAVGEKTEVAHRDFAAIFPPPLDATATSTIRRGGRELPVRPEQLSEVGFKFVVPPIEQTTAPNGMRMFYYEAPTSLAFYAVVLLRAGSVYDPADQVGLAELTAHSMRAGGAGPYAPDRFDRVLDELGVDIDVQAQRDFIRFDVFALPDKRQQAMDLLRWMLTAPRFDEAAVEREKALMVERIVRVEDDPAELSRREFRKVVYGTTHPLARSPQPSDVKRLTRREVVGFYETHVVPSATWLGIAYAQGRSPESHRLSEAFGQWSKNRVPPTRPPAWVPPDGRPVHLGVFLLEKDLEQVYFRVGHFGRRRDPSDQPVVDVLNNIFGTGGLTSRLMQKVRTEHGLAYGVGGGVFEDDPVGVFAAVGSTKAGSVTDALSIVLATTSETLAQLPSTEELETAKRDAIFSFATRFSSPRETLVQFMTADFYGFPPTYLRDYCRRVEQVSAQDVLAAARRYIHPQQATILITGPSNVRPAVEKRFGPIRTWETPYVSPASGESAQSQRRHRRPR